jgi:hypothetical protein
VAAFLLPRVRTLGAAGGFRNASAFKLEDLLHPHSEDPCDAQGEQQRRHVPALLEHYDGLAGAAYALGKLLLRQTGTTTSGVPPVLRNRKRVTLSLCQEM